MRRCGQRDGKKEWRREEEVEGVMGEEMVKAKS